MSRFLKVISLSALGLLMTGCVSESRYHGTYSANAYMQNAQTLPPITVPNGINSPVGEQLYPIPWTDGKATPKLSLVPPDPDYQHYLWEQKQSNKKKRAAKKVAAAAAAAPDTTQGAPAI